MGFWNRLFDPYARREVAELKARAASQEYSVPVWRDGAIKYVPEREAGMDRLRVSSMTFVSGPSSCTFRNSTPGYRDAVGVGRDGNSYPFLIPVAPSCDAQFSGAGGSFGGAGASSSYDSCSSSSDSSSSSCGDGGGGGGGE